MAAHATTAEGVKNALNAGVDSIEHGHRADVEDLKMMKEKGVFLVPTVGVIDAMMSKPDDETMTPERKKRREAFMQGIQQSIQQAMSLGVKIASGYDASSADRQGHNANELIALTKRGLSPLDAIRAATVNAAELIGWQDKIGAAEAGKYADLIAVDGDPLTDIAILQQVKFVMKGGAVVKNDISH